MPFQGNETQREWQASEPLDPASWVPLSSLAVEGFGRSAVADGIEDRTGRLARELSEHTVYDDVGRACVPRHVAREMFTARNAQQQRARREREEHRAALGVDAAALRQRIRAIAERQAEIPDVDAEHGMPASALANLTAADYAARVNKKSGHMDEYLSGGMTYHRLADEQE